MTKFWVLKLTGCFYSTMTSICQKIKGILVSQFMTPLMIWIDLPSMAYFSDNVLIVCVCVCVCVCAYGWRARVSLSDVLSWSRRRSRCCCCCVVGRWLVVCPDVGRMRAAVGGWGSAAGREEAGPSGWAGLPSPPVWAHNLSAASERDKEHNQTLNSAVIKTSRNQRCTNALPVHTGQAEALVI